MSEAVCQRDAVTRCTAQAPQVKPTGPVVTPPQSQATPIKGSRSGFPHIIQHEERMVGARTIMMIGFSGQSRMKRRVPTTAATPTPSPMARTISSIYRQKRGGRYQRCQPDETVMP